MMCTDELRMSTVAQTPQHLTHKGTTATAPANTQNPLHDNGNTRQTHNYTSAETIAKPVGGLSAPLPQPQQQHS